MAQRYSPCLGPQDLKKISGLKLTGSGESPTDPELDLGVPMACGLGLLLCFEKNKISQRSKDRAFYSGLIQL
jgi:hypothetical protein